MTASGTNRRSEGKVRYRCLTFGQGPPCRKQPRQKLTYATAIPEAPNCSPVTAHFGFGDPSALSAARLLEHDG
eukprot:4547622-Prymnesium_polylepis.1